MESVPWTLDDVREGLLALRAAAGAPSFTELSRRIAASRTARGLPASDRHVARATVHHAFQPGRRRISEDLLGDILRALGADKSAVDHWVRVSRAAQRRLDAASVVSVQDRLPEPAAPSVERGISQEVLELVRDGAQVVVLAGMPGSGKTQLALQVARRLLAETDLDGGLHVDLRGHHPEQPPVDASAAQDAAVRVMGGGAGRARADEAARRRRYQDLLVEQPRVLVLDDADDAAQVASLLPEGGRSVVLVTSRTALELPGARRVTVTDYTVEESIALLAAIAGPERMDAEPEAARALLDTTGHLPLSVTLAASRVASRPDWRLADHVELAHHRLSGLRLDELVHSNLTRSYVALTTTGRSALRLLAAQPFPTLDRTDIAALLGRNPAEEDPVLDELMSRHLVASHGDSSLRLHPLVQTFGLDQSLEEDPPAVRRDALVRLADHFVAMTWTDHLHQRGEAARRPPAGVVPAPVATGPAHAWIEASTENLLLLAANAREWGLEGHVVPLSAALAHWLNVSGRYREGVELHELALAAATRSGDDKSSLLAQLDLGMVLIRLDDWEAATTHLELAMAGFAQTSSPAEAREALNALAIRDAQQGHNEDAAAKFALCADLARTAGDAAGIGASLDNTAIVLRRLNRYDEALEHHSRARQAARESSDVSLEARSLVNAAALLVSLGRPDEALESAAAGLLIADAHGILPVTGYGQENLASALRLLGRPLEAADHHRASLRVAEQLGDEHLELAALIGLGEDLLTQDPVEATAHLEAGLVLAESIGEPLDRVRAWSCLAATAQALDDPDAARWHRCTEEYVADLAPHEQELVRGWLALNGV